MNDCTGTKTMCRTRTIVMTICSVISTMLVAACAGTPTDPDPLDREVTVERSIGSGVSVGDLDISTLNEIITARAREQGMLHPTVIWSMPVALFEGRYLMPGNHDEFSNFFGWEVVIVITLIDRTSEGSDAGTSSTRHLILASMVREPIVSVWTGGDDNVIEYHGWDPWILYTDSDDIFQSFVLLPDTLNVEDAAFHVERMAGRTLRQETPLIDRDECVTLDEAFMRNWDTLFNARPRFAYPICN
jgi:hypothetical protein